MIDVEERLFKKKGNFAENIEKKDDQLFKLVNRNAFKIKISSGQQNQAENFEELFPDYMWNLEAKKELLKKSKRRQKMLDKTSGGNKRGE